MNPLFNCCEGEREPDWRCYTGLELSGCKDHRGETEAMVPVAEAEFFTVYGRRFYGCAEAITDCSTSGDALAIGAELVCRSGLALIVHPSLSGASA